MPTPDYPGSTLGEAFGLILLARFVEKIGVRVFPAWTGTEATAEEVDLLPQLAAATNGDRICAALLLNRHHPDLGRQDFISPPWSAADNERRHQLWCLAQQLAEGERKEAAPALHRLRSVQTEIIRQSSTGKLLLKICRVQGGPWRDFRPEWWNRDKPEHLFDSCIIDPAYPFSERPNWKPNTDSWIFAPAEGVDQIVACLTAPPEAKPQFPRADSVDPPKPPVAEPEVASSSPVDAMTTEQPGESTVDVQASVRAQSAPEQSEMPPPGEQSDEAAFTDAKQLNDPAVGVQASVRAQSAPEQSEMPPPGEQSDEAASTGTKQPDQPQAVASEESPPPRELPGELTVGSAGEETAPAHASVADASVSVANTEASVAEPEVASSSPVDAMATEQPGELTVGVQASVRAEQLTYAQIADQLGRSPEAARALVARRRLPRARGSDGKILVTINLQEIHYRLQSARSPGGHRPMTGRSPGGHHPVAKPETAAPATENDLGKPTPEVASTDAEQPYQPQTIERFRRDASAPVASEELPSPDKQLNDPVVGVQASVPAQSAPEQSEMPPGEQPDEAASTDANKQPDQPQTIAPFYSGGPGRPTAVEFVVKEAKRRIEAGEVKPTPRGLEKFAKEIHLWWETEREKYNLAPKVSAKTLRNKLGVFWRSKI